MKYHFVRHCENRFLLHVNMSEARLTQKMKGYAAIVSLAANQCDLKIAVMLKLAQSFISKVRSELKAASVDVATVSYIVGDLALPRHRNSSVVSMKLLESRWRHFLGSYRFLSLPFNMWCTKSLLEVVRDEEMAVFIWVNQG